MRCLLTILFFQIFLTIVFSQKITGIVEYDKKGVEFANIILKSQDSIYIAGTATDSIGAFFFDDVREGKYLIEISHLGFVKRYINIEKNSLNLEPLRIQLEPNNTLLNEVKITSTMPLLSKKNNLIQMQIENSFLENFSSVPDVLSYLPGVIVQSDGIKLFGKEGVLILIDDREVFTFSEIEILSLKSIKNISIEKNPGVKYDSKYKSVLRINTKKLNNNMIEFSHSSIVARKYSNTESVDVKYSKGKTFLSIQGSTRFRNNKNNYEVDLINLNTESKYYNQQSILNNRKSYDLSVGIKHSMQEKHFIQIFNDFYIGTNKPVSSMDTKYMEGGLIEKIGTLKESAYSEKNNRLNIIYNVPIRKSNNFQFNFDYIYKFTEDKQLLRETNESIQNIFDIYYNGKYNVFRSMIDFNFNTLRFADLNFGATFLLVNNTTKNHSNNSDPVDKYYSRNKLTEKYLSYFVSLQKTFNKNSIEIGVRNEYEYFRNNYINKNSLSERKINSFFPYVSLDFNLSKNFKFSITYDRKMDLPSYQQMNSIITYFDRYTYSIGNSELKPVFYNNISLNMLLYNSLNISIEQSFIKGKIIEVPIQKGNSTNEIIFTPVNINLIKSSTLNVYYSKTIKNHRINIGGGALFQKTHATLNEEDISKASKPAFYFSTTYGYKIMKAYPYLRLNYFSKYGDLITTNSNSLNFSLGCNLSLFDEKLTVSLLINDIFKTGSSDWKTTYYPIESSQINDIDSRYFSLTVKYRINKLNAEMKRNNINDILNRL